MKIIFDTDDSPEWYDLLKATMQDAGLKPEITEKTFSNAMGLFREFLRLQTLGVKFPISIETMETVFPDQIILKDIDPANNYVLAISPSGRAGYKIDKELNQ